MKLAGPTSLLGRTVFGQSSAIDTPSHNGHLSTKGPTGGKVAEGRTEDIGRQVNSICRKLLLYPSAPPPTHRVGRQHADPCPTRPLHPALYTIVVTPICVVRMYTGTHDLFKAASFPWGVIVFASTVEALSGLFNVGRFPNTPPPPFSCEKNRLTEACALAAGRPLLVHPKRPRHPVRKARPPDPSRNDSLRRVRSGRGIWHARPQLQDGLQGHLSARSC